MAEEGASEFPRILEGRVLRVAEHGDFRGVLALVGKQQRQIGILVVVHIPKPQRDELVLREFHLVAPERFRRRVERQILLQGAHILKCVAVRILDHLPNLLRRRLRAGRALPHVYAGRLQPLPLQVIGPVAALADLDAYDPVFLKRVPHEHGHIRCDGITDAVGQTGIGFIHVVNAD